MIKVKVGLTDGRSKILEFDKPFDDITASEIMAKVGDYVIGWGLVEEECCIKYPIDEIWEAEDATEASETDVGL